MLNIIKKWSKMPDAFKATSIFFIANIVQKGIAFISSPIYTRLLTTEEFGEVSIFLSWYSLLGIIAMFCLSFGVFNNGMLEYEEDRNTFTFSLLILSNIITIIFSIVFCIGNRFIKDYISISSLFITVMFLLFMLQPALDFWTARQRYEYKYKLSAIVTIISSIITTISAIIFIILFKDNKVFGRIIGFYFPLIVIYIIVYIHIMVKAKFKIKLVYWKYAISFNICLIPHYLSMYILNNSDRLMIASFVGNTEAAFYSVAYNIASVVTILWTAINSSLIPYTYEKCKRKDYKVINKITIPILLIYAVGCIIVMLFAPELIMIMAPSEYKSAIYVIPPVIGGVFFSALYSVFGNIVYYYKKPKYVMIASITSAILNLALNYIYIPKYGFIAAGYTTLICYIIQAIIDYYAMKKVVGENVFDSKAILGIAIGMIIMSLLSFKIYHYLLIRYIVLLTIIIAIVVIAMKRKITIGIKE